MRTKMTRTGRCMQKEISRNVRADAMKNSLSVSSAQATRTPIHVHEIFLNCCRKEFQNVEIVTKSGEIIDGVIDGYDKDTIVVHNEMAQLLIYKHSINYISPRNGKRLIIPEREMSRLNESDTTLIINDNKD